MGSGSNSRSNATNTGLASPTLSSWSPFDSIRRFLSTSTTGQNSTQSRHLNLHDIIDVMTLLRGNVDLDHLFGNEDGDEDEEDNEDDDEQGDDEDNIESNTNDCDDDDDDDDEYKDCESKDDIYLHASYLQDEDISRGYEYKSFQEDNHDSTRQNPVIIALPIAEAIRISSSFDEELEVEELSNVNITHVRSEEDQQNEGEDDEENDDDDNNGLVSDIRLRGLYSKGSSNPHI